LNNTAAADTNPFSTKFWTAGTISFRFSEPGVSADSLLAKAEKFSVCQIAGPHGSGKSALLLSMLNQYKERENPAEYQYLLFNEQNRKLPVIQKEWRQKTLFVDGFEQLPLHHRLRLRYFSKRMILTVHKPLRFIPVLYRTIPQFSIFAEIVRQISPVPPAETVLREVFEKSGGNFRNAFFDLYDRWENLPLPE
jgi:hypothetical protein